MSKPRNFAAVPWRSAGDVRLNDSDRRVLIAICRARQPDTNIAIVTQKTLAQRTSLHRNTVGRSTRRLEKHGYVRCVSRGRIESGPKRGRFKTLAYVIHYDAPDNDPAQTMGCKPHAPDGRCNAAHNPGGADSYSSESEYFSSSSITPGAIASDGPIARQCDLVAREDGALHSEIQEVPESEGDIPSGSDIETGAQSTSEFEQLARALVAAEEFQDACEEAARLGVPLEFMRRCQEAQMAAARLVSFETLIKADLDASRGATSAAVYIRLLTEAYESLIQSNKNTGT